ncbi:hypothetical protein HNY73_013009 [Argiope bruennichi]|uniref:Uncharacterized protein n=1 Tax=Argiope bruennichi TaxID=94029 RepID=A0A8T0EYJ3_ARGBR|nr:hypothetical protein HNY73_013009 [Argiope bruennichi]
MKRGYTTAHLTQGSSAAWTAAGKSRPKQPAPNSKVNGQAYGIHILKRHVILFINYHEKGKTIYREYYTAFIDRLWRRNLERKKLICKRKKSFSTKTMPGHEPMKTMVKLNGLRFELLPHPPYLTRCRFQRVLTFCRH